MAKKTKGETKFWRMLDLKTQEQATKAIERIKRASVDMRRSRGYIKTDCGD